MNASDSLETLVNLTTDTDTITAFPPPPPPAPCLPGVGQFRCMADQLDTEHRFLAIVILALAFVVLALCVLVGVLTMLVHKIGSIWMSAVLGIGSKASGGSSSDKDDPNDARKVLLGESLKSSLASSSKSKSESKKKKASFAEDTSCAPPRDVDEEDL